MPGDIPEDRSFAHSRINSLVQALALGSVVFTAARPLQLGVPDYVVSQTEHACPRNVDRYQDVIGVDVNVVPFVQL